MNYAVKMMMLLENIKATLRNQKGQGMVEYGLILAVVAVAVIGVMATMGGDIKTMFTNVSGELTKAR